VISEAAVILRLGSVGGALIGGVLITGGVVTDGTFSVSGRVRKDNVLFARES
jgi:hypothetical protein